MSSCISTSNAHSKNISFEVAECHAHPPPTGKYAKIQSEYTRHKARGIELISQLENYRGHARAITISRSCVAAKRC